MCHSQYASGSLGEISAYFKELLNSDECKSACEKHIACTGFAIVNSSYTLRHGCYVFGNHSSFNDDDWSDSLAWRSNSYGFKSYQVYASDGTFGVYCFKRLHKPELELSKFISQAYEALV